MRLVTSKNRVIQKYLESFRIQYFGAFWSSLNKEDCTSIKQDQTQLFSTTQCLQSSLRKFIERTTCMKTRDQLCQRKSVILRPRVVLEADSQSGSQDLLVQEKEARSSWESQQEAESYGWKLTTEYVVYRSQRWNCRMHGVKITSQNWSRCSRNISIRNNSSRTRVKKQEISRFSEESQTLLDDVNHTEIFELYENSAKRQCLDCNASSEIGIIPCNCGRNLKYSRNPATLQKTNCDFTSIPGFVHQEEFQSRTKTWCLWKTGDVSHDEEDA